jgi:hypothetical protein
MNLNITLGEDLRKFYLANRKPNRFFNLELTDLFRPYVYIIDSSNELYKTVFPNSMEYPLTFLDNSFTITDVLNVFEETYNLNLYNIVKVDCHFKEDEPRIIRFRMSLKN